MPASRSSARAPPAANSHAAAMHAHAIVSADQRDGRVRLIRDIIGRSWFVEEVAERGRAVAEGFDFAVQRLADQALPVKDLVGALDDRLRSGLDLVEFTGPLFDFQNRLVDLLQIGGLGGRAPLLAHA